MIRSITEQMRVFGNRTIRVSLTYDSDRKRFNISAVEAQNDGNFTSYMLHELKFGTVPLQISRWSKKAGEQAKAMLEEHLAPVLKEVFKGKLQELKSEDFEPLTLESTVGDNCRHLKNRFVASCDMIDDPTLTDCDQDENVKGWTNGKVDERPVRLFLQLVWKDHADKPDEFARYHYQISVQASDLH